MNKLSKLVWPFLALAISAVLISSCSQGTQNTNTATNTNRSVAISNEITEAATSDADDPCKEASVGGKLNKLKKAIEDKVKNDTGGSDPLAAQFNRNFYLDFQEGTGIDQGFVIAVVSGAIQGEKNFKKLADFIEDFVKKGCKIKVVYRASNKITTATPPAGFEWCESPMQACPGGYCAESCNFLESNTSVNANANSNSNTRSNSNVNANTNVNAKARPSP